MHVRPLIFILLVTVSVIAVVHALALEFALYWLYPWFDVPMHFFGGASIALCIWVAIALSVPYSRYFNSFGGIVLGVVIVGVGWELFELWAGLIPQSNYVFDTTLDLIMDACGGVVGYVVGARLNRLET